jgi:hypothetical protein
VGVGQWWEGGESAVDGVWFGKLPTAHGNNNNNNPKHSHHHHTHPTPPQILTPPIITLQPMAFNPFPNPHPPTHLNPPTTARAPLLAQHPPARHPKPHLQSLRIPTTKRILRHPRKVAVLALPNLTQGGSFIIARNGEENGGDWVIIN